MPELSISHIALMAATAIVGAVVGWIIRGNRSDQEKAAVNAGWQNQIDAQRREGERLVGQNKGLMEQVSQFQASHTDAKNRARELSGAVQEAFARRDDLQREIKDIRGNLESAVNERDQLQSDMEAFDSTEDVLREKDAKIEKLMQELENWQNRLPPLIERFRARNEEAERLEAELTTAQERIRELEHAQNNDSQNQTRIEPVTDPGELTDGLDASNDEDTSVSRLLETDTETELEDERDAQIDDEAMLEQRTASEPEYDPEPDPEPDPDPDPDPDPEPEPEPEPESGQESAMVTHDVRNDLKMIKGVGPAIEKTLNEMGIFSFQQIADMSEYDIDRVAQRLKGFRTRIYREDWIGQARILRDQAVIA